MKKHNRLSVLLVLSLACTSANAIEHYTIEANTVIDNFTGLEWQRNSGEDESSQKKQQEYCDKLVLNGKSDWRLPTVEELSTLPDRTRTSPAVDRAAFPNTPGFSQFWSSSPVLGQASNAWVVYFSEGMVLYDNIGSNNRARCVR